MSVQDIYQQWKPTVMGRVIGDGQCVSLVVNNPSAYAEALFPGMPWQTIFPPVSGARQLMGDANQQYFEVIPNNHNDSNQLPEQGDIMVFDATPQPGYTNTYDNPYGHTGVCESADAAGYRLLQQNSPASGASVNITAYPWHYRPCLGWLRPKLPVPQPVIPAAPPVTPPAPVPLPPAPVAPPPVTPPAPQPAVLPGLVNNVPIPSPTPTVQPAPEPQATSNQGVNMQRLLRIALFLRVHAPVILLAVPVVLQALIDKGILSLPATTMLLVNSVLTLVGVGVIHKRLTVNG